MTKRYPLLIVGLIFVGLCLYIFYAVFIPFMVNRDKTSFPPLQFIGGVYLWLFILVNGVNATLVGLGYYRN
jgi:Na+/H+ antiporter NhaA